MQLADSQLAQTNSYPVPLNFLWNNHSHYHLRTPKDPRDVFNLDMNIKRNNMRLAALERIADQSPTIAADVTTRPLTLSLRPSPLPPSLSLSLSLSLPHRYSKKKISWNPVIREDEIIITAVVNTIVVLAIITDLDCSFWSHSFGYIISPLGCAESRAECWMQNAIIES